MNPVEFSPVCQLSVISVLHRMAELLMMGLKLGCGKFNQGREL